jgi:hypothetical protein
LDVLRPSDHLLSGRISVIISAVNYIRHVHARICAALDEAIDNFQNCDVILTGVCANVLPLLKSTYSGLSAFLNVCSNIQTSMAKIFVQRDLFPQYLDTLLLRVQQLIGDQSQLSLSSLLSSTGDEVDIDADVNDHDVFDVLDDTGAFM